MTDAKPSRRWVANGSIRLAITDHGDVDAEPIVALHGFPESALTWKPVARRLAEAGRWIVTPDLRGFGASDAPRAVRAYRVERLLDDVEAVIRDLGGGPVDLLAHDWGGGLGWLLAERRPHLVRRAVILNVPHPGVLRRAIFRDAGQRKRSSYVLKMQIPIIPERRLSRDRGAYLASLFPAEFYSPETIEQYRDSWSRPGGVRSMLNWYRAAAWDRSLRPPIAPIDVPIAIVWGTQDPLFAPELLDQTAALCTSVEVYREPCGHAPHREIPDRVAEIVLSTGA